MILAVGEALAEFMRSIPGVGWTSPGDLRGPFPSGAPAIFASVAARLGSATALCSVVGGDPFGTLIRRRLEHDGVELSGLRTDPAAVNCPSRRGGFTSRARHSPSATPWRSSPSARSSGLWRQERA